VYVTDGLVDLLTPRALAAVIAHENAHARRRDPLQRSLFAALSDLLLNAPWVLWLRHRHEERAEVSADRAAAAKLGTQAVADAITTIIGQSGGGSSSEVPATSPTTSLRLRPVLSSVFLTLCVAVVMLCVTQAVVLLSSGHFPNL
jgi:Zn-dependent protease with chaperone function